MPCRPPPSTGRHEAVARAGGGESAVAPRVALLARTPKGSPRSPWRAAMIHPTTRVLAAELPGHVGESVEISGWLHRRRALKSVTFLVIRDRSGLAQVVTTGAGPNLPEETVLRIRGTVTANPQAPAGVELTAPTVEVLSSLAEAPPFSLFRPTVEAALPVVLDGAPVTLRHPGCPRCTASRRPPWPGSAPPWTGSASPRSTRPRWSPQPPSPARTSSRWTGSGGRRTWRSRRSSSSRRWSGCSSGSTRPGRCSGPNRTTPHGIWRSTPASTRNSVSSPTTAR